MVDAGFENQKELTKMQLDNQKEIAEMQNETQKEIAGIQSATSDRKSGSAGMPRCKMRLKKRLLAFSRRLHARIRKTRYMRSEERFSRNAETDLVCRLLLEKKKEKQPPHREQRRQSAIQRTRQQA